MTKHLPSLTEPDHDPRLFLEEIDGDKALAWVKTQNARTLERFGGESFEKDREIIAALLDRSDKIAMPTRRGGLIYNFWTDAQNPRGLWRRTTLASYESQTPEWDILLDLDALATAENEDWIWRSANSLQADQNRVLLSLSRGGADAVVIREFDLASRSFVNGGFALPEAKQSAVWVDADTLLVTSVLGDHRATQSGYANSVRLWRRGEAFETAKTIFTVPHDHLGCEAQIDRSVAPFRVIFGDWLSFFDEAWHIGDLSGPKQRLDLPTDAHVQLDGDALCYKLRTEAMIVGKTYQPDMLLGDSLSHVLAGKPQPEVLFTPTARHILQSFTFVHQRLVLQSLDNLAPRFQAFRLKEKNWQPEPINGVPDGDIVSLWAFDAFDEESNGDLLCYCEGPLTPPALHLLSEGGERTMLKSQPALFDKSGLHVERFEAMSSDGEKIPYTIIGPRAKTGKAPVLLYGYGGFDVTLLPHYNGTVGKMWLEKGGTYVLAHLRGGGEFGTRWHKAGMREQKYKSHDDFAAIAADLVTRGITQPHLIAAEGGSNGGILISNMLTRYPERFGALFCTIPLIDMRRFPLLLAGASWVAEYGDPSGDDWDFIKAFSAYHHALDKDAYPPILIATSQRDDRVHPGHARKMAMKLQENGLDCWFYEPADGGHGYGKTSKEKATFTALGYAFFWAMLNLKA